MLKRIVIKIPLLEKLLKLEDFLCIRRVEINLEKNDTLPSEMKDTASSQFKIKIFLQH